MELALIAAVARNGVIGADGELPWHYPADLRHFKETTTGHPVIMGRVTFEAILDRLGHPLPDRTSVVLTSRDPEALDLDPEWPVVVVHSIDNAVEAAAEHGADVAYVMGGASVYEQFLPRADRLVLTEIGAAFEGDTFFPEIDSESWVETAREEQDELAFVTYEREDD